MEQIEFCTQFPLMARILNSGSPEFEGCDWGSGPEVSAGEEILRKVKEPENWETELSEEDALTVESAGLAAGGPG